MASVFDDSIEFGEGLESVQSAEPSVSPGVSAPSAFEETEDSTAAAEIQEPSDQGQATALGQGAQDIQDGTQQQQAPAEQAASEELSEEAIAKLEQEAEAALSNTRTPNWFKNAVESVYKPKLASLTGQVEKYSALGTPEEIEERVGLLQKLGEIRTDPQTRMPVKTTDGFVKEIYEKDPEIAQQLMSDLAVLPAPDGSGQTVIQALFNKLGVDPNRLPDIQKFAAGGYQLQAAQYAPPDPSDLAAIPEHLHATFAKLSPEIRDSLMGDIDHIRNQNLEAHRYRIDNEERQQAEEANRQQYEQQQLQQQQYDFGVQVDTKAQENFETTGNSVLTTFVESLAKQAGMSQLDSLIYSNAFLNALEPTVAGRATFEALKKEGIEIDPAIGIAADQLRELSHHAAYYELINDQQNLRLVAGQIAETQERLLAKGNKVIAALAGKRSGNIVRPAVEQAKALATTVNDRHAFSGAPRTETPVNDRRNLDYSDESYVNDLRADGFR